MTKQELIEHFYNNHIELIDFISNLSDDQFRYSNGKWTAGQQLSHIYLCLAPISQALTSKEFIIQKFGLINRDTMDYDEVIMNYKSALEKGGKAPISFVPEMVSAMDRNKLTTELTGLLLKIKTQLSNYTDQELNNLVLPHPLLGNMTIRELIYLMTFHATHHLRQTEQNLEPHSIS
jgi:hypothetical protein